MNSSMKQSGTIPSLLDAREQYMPFLMEVRRRVVLIFAVFFIGSALGFIYYEAIIKIIQ